MSHSLGIGDTRKVFRLIGDLCEDGDNPGKWLPIFLTRICLLTNATGGLSGVHTTENGARSAKSSLFFQYDAALAPQTEPVPCSTRAARQMLNIELNPHQNHHLRSTCGDGISGRQHTVLLWKNVDEAPFMARDRRIVQLLHDELGRLWSRDQKDARPALPLRLQQTLDLLMAGRSEKQIAASLSVSRHTVHDHVKRLHRHFGVSSRGELLALYHPIKRFVPRVVVPSRRN